MRLTQALARASHIAGDRIAVQSDGGSCTWRQLAERCARLAAGLRQMGVCDGARVAILADNSQEYLEALYGAMWAGGIAVPTNARWSAREIATSFDDCEPLVLFVDEAHLSLAREACCRMQRRRPALVISSGEEAAIAEGGRDYEALVAGHAPLEDAGRGYDDVASIFYTGGTTGRPKGVMVTHANSATCALSAMINMELTAQTGHLHAGPLFHLGSAWRVFNVTAAAGRHVIIPRFEPDAVLAAIERHKATIIAVVPTMLAMLLDARATTSYDLSSLSLITYGAAPMPQHLLARAMAAFPGVRFQQSYGMTELGPYVTSLGAADHEGAGGEKGCLASVGQPVHMAEVTIVNADDRPVPAGEVGEIVVRGPMVMKGYWNQPKLTAHVLRNGGMHTGDAGYFDEAGYLYLVDRLKDMIITGGENVYSGEVERVLNRLPGVRECAVVGIPDAHWGEAVCAVIVPEAGAHLAEESVKRHCREGLAAYKCPKTVVLQVEPLARTAAGKIAKNTVREALRSAQRREPVHA